MTIINVKFASNFVAKAKSPKAHVQRRVCGMTAEQPLQRKACEAQTMVVGAGLVVAAEQAAHLGHVADAASRVSIDWPAGRQLLVQHLAGRQRTARAVRTWLTVHRPRAALAGLNACRPGHLH
jgi:hypothetical protein